MPAHHPDIQYWLALWRMRGIGAAKFRLLHQAFKPLSALFSPERFSYPAFSKLPDSLKAYLAAPDWAGVEADLAWAKHENHHIVTREDPDYPYLLAQEEHSPPLLFINGQKTALALPQIGIVGARKATPTGQELAYAFAKTFVENGFALTSGLALGVDGAAHRGALAGRGVTLGVVAHGPDRLYPPQHKTLAAAMVEEGAVITEFPVGVKPWANYFPRRNRLLAGLCVGVVVVEAALKSGSLITARFAAELGREVFAVPGSILNPLSRGCHQLIRQGATLVEEPQDVIVELGGLVGALHPTRDLLPESRSDGSLSASEKCVLKAVGFEPTSMDLLVERTGLTARELSSMLLALELQGWVVSLAGGYMQITKGAL